MSRFKIEVSSRFEELWRYNIIIVCEACSTNGVRVDFISTESIVAPVGSNLTQPPTGYDTNRNIHCECNKGDNLNILIYVIPHTMPSSNDIHKVKPFPLIVKVERDGNAVINSTFNINQWSGDNITLKVEQ